PAPLTRVASGQERAVPVRVELTEALWLDVRIAVQEAAPRAPYDAVRPAGRPLPPGRAEQRLDAAFAAQRAADVLLDLGGRHLRAVLVGRHHRRCAQPPAVPSIVVAPQAAHHVRPLCGRDGIEPA